MSKKKPQPKPPPRPTTAENLIRKIKGGSS